MNSNVIKKLNSDIGKDVAYVLITSSKGSAPSRVGDSMLVYLNDTFGTCGGGQIEFEIIKLARESIKSGKPQTFSFNLSSIGMSCGGEVEGFIDIMKTEKLYIIGAGHVGSEIYKLADNLDFSITVIDEREEFANEVNYPNASIIQEPFSSCLDKIDVTNSYITVATKGHDTDHLVVKKLINKDYKYLGLIGSKKKIKEVKDDLSNADLSKFYAPIGIDIAKTTPSEIAISIMAEILKIKNSGSLRHMDETKNN